MLTQQSNAARIFGQTVSEFKRPLCTGAALGLSFVRDNEPAVQGNNLRNNKV